MSFRINSVKITEKKEDNKEKEKDKPEVFSKGPILIFNGKEWTYGYDSLESCIKEICQEKEQTGTSQKIP
jgi:hypothetical protein